MSSYNNAPEAVTTAEKSKVAKIGPVSLSLLVHLAFMVVIGGVVVIEQVIPKTNFQPAVLGENFDQQGVDEVVEVDESLPDPGSASDLEMPVDTVVTETGAPENAMDVMAVDSPIASSAWMVNAAPSIGTVGRTASGGSSGGGGGTGKGGPRMKNPFGDLTKSSGSLQGTFFDLKQTPDRKPSGMTPAKYFDVVREFEKKDWNLNVLKDFYKASQPVFATQFFIPLQSAVGAPKAFNVEKEVQPAQWLILYQGSFKAPQSGKYRFVGYADDVLMVRINGKTVLDGSRGGMTGEVSGKDVLSKVRQTVNKEHKAGNGWLAYGEWVDLDQNVAQNIEVLLGERPGGQFCAFLMIEAKDASYKKEASGRPILPLFQLAETDLSFDEDIRRGSAPAYAKEAILMSGE